MASDTPLGRPKLFCKRSCRQRDFEARQRATERGLDETDIIVARHERDALLDSLYVLQCAVDDVDRELAIARTPDDLEYAVGWLLDAARPLLALRPG